MSDWKATYNGHRRVLTEALMQPVQPSILHRMMGATAEHGATARQNNSTTADLTGGLPVDPDFKKLMQAIAWMLGLVGAVGFAWGMFKNIRHAKLFLTGIWKLMRGITITTRERLEINDVRRSIEGNEALEAISRLEAQTDNPDGAQRLEQAVHADLTSNVPLNPITHEGDSRPPATTHANLLQSSTGSSSSSRSTVASESTPGTWPGS